MSKKLKYKKENYEKYDNHDEVKFITVSRIYLLIICFISAFAIGFFFVINAIYQDEIFGE